LSWSFAIDVPNRRSSAKMTAPTQATGWYPDGGKDYALASTWPNGSMYLYLVGRHSSPVSVIKITSAFILGARRITPTGSQRT